MDKVSLRGDKIKYLVFEGGGGLGWVYLGAIEGLEEILGKDARFTGQPHVEFPRTIFPINSDRYLEGRPFRGICGASAGAITAFMLALGMTSYEIDTALAQLHDVIIDKGNPKGSAEKWSAAEKFFDPPDPTSSRVFRPSMKGEARSKYAWDNHPEVLAILKKWGRGFVASSLHQVFFPFTGKLRNSYNVIKRTLLIGDLDTGRQSSIGIAPNPLGLFPPVLPIPTTRPVEFKHHDNAATYLHSLLLNRGLFSGMAARQFFRDLVKDHLMAAHFKAHQGKGPLDPDMSFKEFYNVTGVDLVVTGVNISRHEPRYFSVWHTPDFPVVEAVALSMSIPFVFKPVFIEDGVCSGDKEQNKAYQGLYVDGGMLNNYPVRAFDTIAKRFTLRNGEQLQYRGNNVSQVGGVFLAVDPKEGTGGNEPFLGFRLVDLGENPAIDLDEQPVKDIKSEDVFKDDPWAVWGLLKDLYFSFMYTSTKGQLRYANDRSRTIALNVHDLDLLDFAHPNADVLAGRTEQATRKELRKKEAIDRILGRVQP